MFSCLFWKERVMFSCFHDNFHFFGLDYCNYLSDHGWPLYQVDSSSDEKYAAFHNLDSSSASKVLLTDRQPRMVFQMFWLNFWNTYSKTVLFKTIVKLMLIERPKYGLLRDVQILCWFWYSFDILLTTFWQPFDILLISFWYPFDILLISFWYPNRADPPPSSCHSHCLPSSSPSCCCSSSSAGEPLCPVILDAFLQ